MMFFLFIYSFLYFSLFSLIRIYHFKNRRLKIIRRKLKGCGSICLKQLALTCAPCAAPEWSFSQARRCPFEADEWGVAPPSLFYSLQHKQKHVRVVVMKPATGNNCPNLSQDTLHMCIQSFTPLPPRTTEPIQLRHPQTVSTRILLQRLQHHG